MRLKKIFNQNAVFFIFILAVGIFYRLYKIDTVPYGINHDGAWSGSWAIDLAQKPWPIQVYSDQAWLGEAMPRYVIAFFIKIFGPGMLALKLGMMIFSIIALPMLYLLVNKLFNNKRLALFSMFLLAVSGWDITYGKTGWRCSAVPLFVITTVYFFIYAIKSQKSIFFAFTGISMAATLNTYNAGQFIPITIFSASLVYLIKHYKKRRVLLPKYLILIFFFAIFAMPLFIYALTHWENYTGRARFLSVFSKISREKSLLPAWLNIKYAALMYTVTGYFGADFYLKEPLLEAPTSWLFLTGIIAVLFYSKNKRYLFFLFLFITSLIPSLLGNPDGGHAIGTIPAVYIFAGIGLENLYKLLSQFILLKRFNIPLLTVASILVIAAVNTFNIYLGPHRYERWGFYPETTVVAYYMKPKITKYDIYLTDNFPRGTLRYLTYQEDDPWQQHYAWLEKKEEFLNVILSSKNKGLIFIMAKYPENQSIIDSLQIKYPRGYLKELTYTDDFINRPAAWVFTVEPL